MEKFPNGAGERPETEDVWKSEDFVPEDFEDYLKWEHSKSYSGTDDDMPDKFDNWLQNLDVDEWLMYGESYKKFN